MSIEKTKSTDTMSSGLIAGTRPVEQMTALGYFTIQCFDKDGKLKWEDENHNLVVNTGLQYMAGVALNQAANLVTQISSWFIGLAPAQSGWAPSATATLSALGFTEFNSYSGNRKQCSFAAATLPTGTGNPSIATNSASQASFSINAAGTVGGAFLCSAASGTSGTLFSQADFSAPGDRTVASGDTLNVTYEFRLAG
jgi:hypothetical protein